MKIALVLTGHMRCWHTVFSNTFEHIISKFSTDVFIATWDTEGYWTSPENDNVGAGINMQSPKLQVEAVKKVYGPNVIEVQNQMDFLPGFHEIGRVYQPYCKEIRPANILSQFYIQHRGLRHAFAGYDLVIRMRPDLILTSEVTEAIRTADPKKVYTIHHRNHTGEGTGDMFVMGFREDIKLIGYNLVNTNFLMETTLKYNRFCPHILMKEAIGDKLVELNIGKSLMHTPNGQYKDWNPK